MTADLHDSLSGEKQDELLVCHVGPKGEPRVHPKERARVRKGVIVPAAAIALLWDMYVVVWNVC